VAGLASGSYFQHMFSYDAVGMLGGFLGVEAVPVDGGAKSFSCRGMMLVSFAPPAKASYGYGGLLYYGGYLAGVADYQFALQPQVSAGQLTWHGSCPITSLPVGYIAMSHHDLYIHRRASDGSWAPQYYADPRDFSYDPDYGAGLYVSQWESLTTLNEVSWRGYYLP